MNKLKRVCGLDVHKDIIFACVKKGKYQSEIKQFSTTTQGLSELNHWLQGEHVLKVAMESTGVYWMPVWRALEDKFSLLLVNPYFIKQMPGRKSDVQDAQWIATLADKQLLRGSVVPCKTIRVLRSYLRRYAQLQGQTTRCLQQMEKQLSQCNIKIASLSSTIGSKTVIGIVESISKGNYAPEQLLKLVHGRILNRHKENVIQSLQGIIEEHDVFLLRQIYEDYQHIERQCNELLAQAQKIAEAHYHEQLNLLQTIPGIKQLSAVIILAELGGNIQLFGSAEQLTGWCGLRPKNDESAGKIKSRSITKGNKYLRRILVQTAWAASRTKTCYLKTKFEQLSIRKSSKSALIAIARKQLVIIWNVLAKQQVYQEPKIKLSPEQIIRKQKYYREKLNKLQAQQIFEKAD
ncbi:MAG TPA: IS110 family transposase, partial [Bacteroidales bacterium]|nr:IS110 family transposase [Bacteroidales bacterium]